MCVCVCVSVRLEFSMVPAREGRGTGESVHLQGASPWYACLGDQARDNSPSSPTAWEVQPWPAQSPPGATPAVSSVPARVTCHPSLPAALLPLAPSVSSIEKNLSLGQRGELVTLSLLRWALSSFTLNLSLSLSADTPTGGSCSWPPDATYGGSDEASYVGTDSRAKVQIKKCIFLFSLSFLKEDISKPNSIKICSLLFCFGLSLMTLNVLKFLIYRRAAVFLLNRTF